MKSFNYLAMILLVITVSTSCVFGLLDQGLETAPAPIREGEKPIIPLDTKDPTYHIWNTLRDMSKDP